MQIIGGKLRFAKDLLTALALSSIASLPQVPTSSPPEHLHDGIDLNSDGCVGLPLSSNACINFDGDLAPWNDQISNVIVPSPWSCEFFLDFDCGNGGTDVVFLGAGTWDMFSVPTSDSSLINFNDKASSFGCFPF
ncbi:hypothetical protein B0H14DRAFT_2651583 [Mycena olivaceomarginata]|nr:hypothetical protein B0H14DRAFT_2651583 [Mycena olivaceomarginata]